VNCQLRVVTLNFPTGKEQSGTTGKVVCAPVPVGTLFRIEEPLAGNGTTLFPILLVQSRSSIRLGCPSSLLMLCNSFKCQFQRNINRCCKTSHEIKLNMPIYEHFERRLVLYFVAIQWQSESASALIRVPVHPMQLCD